MRRADLGCGRQGPRLAPLPALQAAIGAAVDARAGPRRAPTRYERYGFVASSYNWSGSHARRRGGTALARYESGDWPTGPVIRRLYGSAANARADAFPSPT